MSAGPGEPAEIVRGKTDVAGPDFGGQLEPGLRLGQSRSYPTRLSFLSPSRINGLGSFFLLLDLFRSHEKEVHSWPLRGALMGSSPSSAKSVVFGEFEANLRTRELLRNGTRIRLPDQSFQVLTLLLVHAGELVTRDDIRKALWPGDTFVDFDHGLNNAVNRLREALGDSADSHKLIETLPRRGYRFVGTVTTSDSLPGSLPYSPSESQQEPEAAFPWVHVRSRPYAWLILIAIAVSTFSLAGLKFRTRPQAPSTPIHSIAVLPLQNLSGDPSQDYFADGMTDSLITDLANIKSLRVVSRTSTMHYKGSRQPLPEIARELRVDAMVEGSVIRSGNRVRVNAQLVQASSDRHLWAKIYDRNASEILAVQQDLAQSIVREIQAKLTLEEQNKLASVTPVNGEAYEAYLKGRYYLNLRSLDGYNHGLRFMQEAIGLDPTYAAAYAGLADCYNLLGLGMGSISAIEAARQARSAAQHALKLDPTLAEAHAALAVTLHRYDWNWTEAETEYKRAIELSPQEAIYHTWYSGLLSDLGRSQDAHAQVNVIHDMDPLSVQGARAVASTYLSAKQHDQATAYIRKVIEQQRDSFRLRMDMGTGYLEHGHNEEAVAEFKKVLELYGPNVFPMATLGIAYGRMGRRADAERILAELKDKGRPGYSSYAIAQISAALGRNREALSWLQRAYNEHAAQMVGVNGDQAFDPLHTDPRFQDLVRRVGLPMNDSPG